MKNSKRRKKNKVCIRMECID